MGNINFVKIKNTCNHCPYLETPAYDLGEADQYYTCRLSYANTYNLEHFDEICPLKNVKQILAEFICFRANLLEQEPNFKKEKQIIKQFIEDKL